MKTFIKLVVSSFLIFLAVLGLAMQSAYAQENSPPLETFDCSDKPNGIYSNPEDCRTFYKCSKEGAYLYDCPANLEFNPTLLVCDWPENAGCSVVLPEKTSFFNNPLKSTVVGSIPTTGNWGNRCSL